MNSIPTLWAVHESLLPFVKSLPTATPQPKQQAVARSLPRVPMAQERMVAVISIFGTISQRPEWWGGASTDEIGQMLDVALASPASTVILDIDSPGGSVYGVRELSDKIFAARAAKPIIAVCNSMACSAAFWIATAASKFYITPGGDTGSLGVYSLHVDYSKQLEADGLRVTITRAGAFKAEGNPYEPLSTDAQANIQAGVDSSYREFVKAIARNRGLSTGHVLQYGGQGRCLDARAARAAGMVDGIQTFESVFMDAIAPRAFTRHATATGSKTLQQPSSAQLVRRLRHEQQKRKTVDMLSGVRSHA